MLAGRVVGHKIDQDPQSQRMRVADELVDVVDRTEDRVDIAVVGDVVARVDLW
jgi:hypothetical protein